MPGEPVRRPAARRRGSRSANGLLPRGRHRATARLRYRAVVSDPNGDNLTGFIAPGGSCYSISIVKVDVLPSWATRVTGPNVIITIDVAPTPR